MELNRPSGLIASVFAAIFLTIVLGSTASAAIREKAYAFNGTDGTGYRAGLRLDATGNLWCTSPFGGVYGYGNVFELTRDTKGHLTETVLYSFTNGNDGGYPVDDDGPTADSAGNLYGTTAGGGAYGGGAVFKLMPSRNGWQESVLYSFTCGSDGCFPEASIVFDTAGNLYGTTWGGGPGGSGYGTVFELSPDSIGHWTETTLHVFTGGSDGAGSSAGLIFDQSGNLYGTTGAGGSGSCHFGAFYGCGVVFKLIHTTSGWKERVLHSFTGGRDGASPFDRLVFDPSGNLYGTAANGGDPSCGCGTVFRLAAPKNFRGQWSQTVLHTFTGGRDGAFPIGGVIFDAMSNLYGAASAGGKGSCVGMACGTVFSLVPNHHGGWSFDVLYSFAGKGDGGEPFGVVLGRSVKLYGAAGQGGYFGGNCAPSNGCGTVFELTTTLGPNWLNKK